MNSTQPKRLGNRVTSRIARWLSARIAYEESVVLRSALKRCDSGAQLYWPCIIAHPERVTIGADVSIAPYCHIWGTGGVSIGDRTMIASHVAITSATHDPRADLMRTTMITAEVKISNDVWIGAHAVILPGVEIGEHSVIAAGSVVRDNVAPYSVVGGVPADVIRAHRQSNAPAMGNGKAGRRTSQPSVGGTETPQSIVSRGD